jgi:hypothetical protein
MIMSYSERQAIYEAKKKQISKESKSKSEYEKRIKALAKKLNI